MRAALPQVELLIVKVTVKHIQPVREAVSYRGLFTAGWFGVREKHCSRLEIYDRLRASEQARPPSDLLLLKYSLT